MKFNNVDELELICVLHRGVPNKECIALKVRVTTNMGQYGLLIGTSTGDGGAVPIGDNFFWFGEGIVQPNEWIFVYTGEGIGTKSQGQDGHNVYTVYWGRKSTMFANSLLVPLLFCMGAVTVDSPPTDLPQLPRLR